MNSPPELEKNACTFLFILFIPVCGRLSLSSFVKVSKNLAEGNFFYIKKSS